MKLRIVAITDLGQAQDAIRATGADPYSVAHMAAKLYMRCLRVDGVDNRAAAILKQEMLSLGAEAAVSRAVGGFVKGRSSVLLAGTRRQLELLCAKLQVQPFGLKELATQLRDLLETDEQTIPDIRCGGNVLKLGRAPRVMGIVNATPDSFADGGKYAAVDAAVAHGCKLAEEGAAIIDVGGESTRPGARPVTEAEECRRVVPVIRALSRRLKHPVSVDTMKPGVARAALDAGAVIINDIAGLGQPGGAMAKLAASYSAAVVLMHMKGTPRTMQKNPAYTDVVAEIIRFFEERMAAAAAHGCGPDQILLDPGIGFGKSAEHNAEILRRFAELRSLGRPMVVGLSRKSFIGAFSGAQNPADRLPGSIAANVLACSAGAQIVRVHDVKETVQAVKIFTAVKGM